MKNSKIWWMAVAALAIGLTFAGCASTTETTETDGAETTDATETSADNAGGDAYDSGSDAGSYADAGDTATEDADLDVVVPSGTAMIVRFLDELSSATAQVGDTFSAEVVLPVEFEGNVVIPTGSMVTGTVTEANAANRFGGIARLSLAFDGLRTPAGDQAAIAATLVEETRGEKKKDAARIGGGAAAGALLGRILNDDDRSEGTKEGAAAGAVIGTAIAAATKGDEVQIPSGTEFEIVLETPVTL